MSKNYYRTNTAIALSPLPFTQSSEKPDERAGTGFLPNPAQEQGLFGGVVRRFYFFLSFLLFLLYTRKCPNFGRNLVNY